MAPFPAALLALLLAGCQSPPDSDLTLSSARDTLSYSLGRSIGARLDAGSLCAELSRDSYAR